MSSTLAAQQKASKTAYDCAAVRSLVYASTAKRSLDYLASEVVSRGSASFRSKLSVVLLKFGALRLTQKLFAQVSPGADIFMFARQFVPDQLVRDALHADPETQVIVLGAGLDTSGLRIGAERSATGLMPGQFFEVDLPAMQQEKRLLVDQIIRSHPGHSTNHIAYVPCSFGENELSRGLKDAGFKPERPAIWVWSGVVHYLTDAAVRATIATIRELSTHGSKVFFDFILLEAYEKPHEYEFAAIKRRFDAYGEVMSFGFRQGTEHVREWLETEGLEFVHLYTNRDMVELYENITEKTTLSSGTPWANLCVASVSHEAK